MLATALVDLQQVQVIDKHGQIRGVIVWRCGPDILVSETMDGLFDTDRRFKAPNWLIEQLDALPPSRKFDSLGNAQGSSGESPNLAIAATAATPKGFDDNLDEDDEDLPGVSPA